MTLPPLVMDASAAIDTLGHPRLAECLVAEHDLCAPTLARWEVGNVVHVHLASKLGDAKTRRAIVATLLRPLRLVDQAGREDAIALLVHEHKLTFYDAAYLQLALDEDAGLVTQDRRLREAAAKVLGARRALSLDEAGRAAP